MHSSAGSAIFLFTSANGGIPPSLSWWVMARSLIGTAFLYHRIPRLSTSGARTHKTNRSTAAAVDGQVGSKRFHFPLTHLLRMNPSACPILVKPQELRDPAPVGQEGARSQSPYFARGFILPKELHSLHSAAQESLGQFAHANSPQLFESLRRSVMDEPTAAAYYY